MKNIRTVRITRYGLWLLAAVTLGLMLSVNGQTSQREAGKATATDGAEVFSRIDPAP